MKRGLSMRTIFGTVTATIGASAIGMLFAAEANAGCFILEQKATPSFWQHRQFGEGQARFISTAFLQVWDQDTDDASVVGLWQFAFVAKGNTGPTAPPDGTPIDAGYVTWHGDGTELMNSGRPPISGDFCMVVWKQIGPSTFKLNHFAMGWDPTGTVLVGPVNIRETVTVSPSRQSYSGAFTLIQYATDEKTVLADIKGTVTATRITVD